MNAPGFETGPGPQLVTWGKSTVCSVDAFGYKFQWTTNSSKHIPFDWSGPWSGSIDGPQGVTARPIAVPDGYVP
jgi:hypothetical protein